MTLAVVLSLFGLSVTAAECYPPTLNTRPARQGRNASSLVTRVRVCRPPACWRSWQGA
jgi:hypothetical protein